ncbi:hypothetical protein MASR2M18_19440 [Ignavibacteria bacterium]
MQQNTAGQTNVKPRINIFLGKARIRGNIFIDDMLESVILTVAVLCFSAAKYGENIKKGSPIQNG